MVKVENKDTCRMLTKQFMKQNRARNVIAVLAILLTCLLFTSLFMGAVSMVLSKRATDVKQFMDSSHAILQNRRAEECDSIEAALKQDKDVARYGYGIFLGGALDTRFGFSTEVRYADENLAESFNCTPTTGTLPKEKDEIAVSTIVLDALDVPHELGETITITYELNPIAGEVKTETFRLSGFWEGDDAVLAQMLWVSKEYAEENRFPITKKDLENGLVNGSMDYAVWFKSLWNLNGKTEQLSALAGLTGERDVFCVNPAYDTSEEDSMPFLSVGIMVGFIILAGYLIIYNIFNISVKTDIRTYGLLKNVGTTGKQLKKIVRMQAWRLSAVGIPMGLILGYGASVLMAPSLNAVSEISAQESSGAETVISANPLLFLGAAAFTLFTVYLSSLKACKMVERISPVEALRLAESDQSKRKTKKNFSVSWCGMAVQNMLREWKRGLIVMLSIALSLVVVNCIVMLVEGYDFESYQKIFLASDFQLDQMTSTLTNTNFDGISPKVREKLEDCPYSTQVGFVYYSDERHEIDNTIKEYWDQYKKRYESGWNDYERGYWDEMQDAGEMRVHFLGINEGAFNKLEWKDAACSWEDFKDGNSVIVDYGDQYAKEPKSYYHPGDIFHMEYQSKKAKDYKVLGEAVMTYSLDYPYADMFYITVMVPEEEYRNYVDNDCAMYAAVDVKEGTEQEMKDYIDTEILSENERMNVFSILDMRKSFERYVRKYYMIGGCLAFVLAFIGIMNFFNTTATSVFNRKRELALLEAVGMTKKQIVKMLVMEGFLYLLGAFGIAVLLICTCAEKLLANTLGKAFFFRMHLTIVPCLCMMPLLFVIAYFIPKILFRKMAKESVTMRIRIE